MQHERNARTWFEEQSGVLNLCNRSSRRLRLSNGLIGNRSVAVDGVLGAITDDVSSLKFLAKEITHQRLNGLTCPHL